jgi:chromosome segregation ATPase
VVASRDPVDLDPYAIVQVPEVSREPSGEERRAAEATLAAAILESKILAAQLEEQRARNAHMDARSGETVQRLEALMAERDAAQARVAELEALAEAARDALGAVERRLLSAEQAILERDDTIAALKGELDALRAEGEELASVDPALLDELAARAERAESALALNVADLARVAEAHAAETAALEAQLRERAKVIASMEKELARREQIVRELVTALEEAREGIVEQPRLLEAAPPTDPEETARLTKKIDDLALEIARREGELVAQAWRIEELENDRAPRGGSTPAAPDPELARELARTKDEIDALRQALTQEHAARVAAESGEELVRVRAELAQKAALLEQMKTRGAHPSDGIE